MLEDGIGDPADTKQLTRLIDYADFPDLRAAAKMDGSCGARNHALTRRFNVVGIDL